LLAVAWLWRLWSLFARFLCNFSFGSFVDAPALVFAFLASSYRLVLTFFSAMSAWGWPCPGCSFLGVGFPTWGWGCCLTQFFLRWRNVSGIFSRFFQSRVQGYPGAFFCVAPGDDPPFGECSPRWFQNLLFQPSFFPKRAPIRGSCSKLPSVPVARIFCVCRVQITLLPCSHLV